MPKLTKKVEINNYGPIKHANLDNLGGSEYHNRSKQLWKNSYFRDYILTRL